MVVLAVRHEDVCVSIITIKPLFIVSLLEFLLDFNEKIKEKTYFYLPLNGTMSGIYFFGAIKLD